MSTERGMVSKKLSQDDFVVIRWLFYKRGLNKAEIAKEFRQLGRSVDRRTVRRVLKGAYDEQA